MAAPGKDLGLCPECDTKLAVVNDTLFCHQCRKVVDGGVDTLRLEANWTDSQRIQAVVEKIAEGTRLIHHAGQVYEIQNGQLLSLNQTRESIERVRRLANVAEGALIRMPTRDEASEVTAAIQAQPQLFPEVDIVVPRSVMYLNHAGEPMVTERGLNGRIYQIGPNIKPERTGVFEEFLEMTPFASEQDRDTYVAWCLSALFPLEYEIGPLFVCYADGQEAGKTWLVRVLAWALGYRKARSMKLLKSGERFRRATIAAMKAGRVLLWDNVVGSTFGFVENNDLSEILTENYAECAALYRVGADELQNRHIWAMTMNGGRLCEDLASRAVSCKLVYDPDHPGIIKRGLIGEGHWMQEKVSTAVLADMLYWAQKRFCGTLEVRGTCGRPQHWHQLCAKLGLAVPPCSSEVREAGDIDADWLRGVLGEGGKTTAQLCEILKASGRSDAASRAAQRGVAQLGLLLTRAQQGGLAIAKKRSETGILWYRD